MYSFLSKAYYFYFIMYIYYFFFFENTLRNFKLQKKLLNRFLKHTKILLKIKNQSDQKWCCSLKLYWKLFFLNSFIYLKQLFNIPLFKTVNYSCAFTIQ